MNKMTLFARRGSVLLFVVAAFIIGVTCSFGMAAHASIPDASGTIHTCRLNIGSTLRVIDSDAGQNCLATETPLNWSQGGAANVVAYAHIYTDANGNYQLDTARSKNITSFSTTTFSDDWSETEVCLTIATTPHSVTLTSGDIGATPASVFLKDANGWTNTNAKCTGTANAEIFTYFNQSIFITLY